MAKEKDINGYWRYKDNPISKVGVFDYLGSEIGAEHPDKIYKVYRPAEELSSKETIDSFRMVPFIDDHTFLGLDGKPPEEVGVMGATGEDVVFDAPYLKATLKVFGDHLKRAIQAGKVELSPSYRCKYVFKPGFFDGQAYDVIQTEIRGNHLALVEHGRTGPDVCVHDCYAFDGALTKDVDQTKEDVKMLEPFTEEQLAQLSVLIGTAVKAAIEEKVEEVEEVVESTDETEETIDETEEIISEERVKEISEKAAEDSRVATIKQLSERDKLVKLVEPYIGAFDHAAFVCDSEVAKYAIDKLKITAPEGQEIPYLRGYLANARSDKDSIVKDSRITKPTAKSVINKLWGIK